MVADVLVHVFNFFFLFFEISGKARLFHDDLLCIIADVCLKGEIDGLEALRQIRKCDLDTPFVVVSSVDSNMWKEKAIALEAIAVLHKPVSASQILAMVKKTLADQVHFAAKDGDLEALRRLVKRGDVIANRNSLCQAGYTALHVAAWGGHLDCVRFLVETGWDPLMRSSRGFTAADLASNDAIKSYLELVSKTENSSSSSVDNNVAVIEGGGGQSSYQSKKASSNDEMTSGSYVRTRVARRRSLSGVTLPVFVKSE